MIFLDLLVALAIVCLRVRFGRPDSELVFGIAVFLGVVGATELTLAMIVSDGLPAWLRVLSSVTAFVLAIFSASKNWKQQSLRWTLAVAGVLIGVLVLTIGRSTLAPGGVMTTRLPFLDTLRTGAEFAIEGLPFQHDQLVVLDAAAWIGLAAIALYFWRLVEKRSAQQLPGPVVVELNSIKAAITAENSSDPARKNSAPSRRPSSTAIQGAPSEDKKDGIDAQLAVFRTALLQNVREPGPLPGTPAFVPLTDLAELPYVATWIAPIITAVKSILAVPAGYKVLGEVVPPDQSGELWSVLARVIDIASGEQVDVSTHSAETDVQACRAAGYWAATVVLERSSRIASWARWEKGTAGALATFDNTEQREPSADEQCRLEKLKSAVAQAPSSGVLLQLLAAEHELVGCPVEALSLYARAVAAHPRYPVACYRLTVLVGSLARNSSSWCKGGDDDSDAWVDSRTRIVKQLIRAGKAMGIKTEIMEGIGSQLQPGAWPEFIRRSPEARKFALIKSQHAFGRLTEELFILLDRNTTVKRVLVRSFRRSERDSWWLSGSAKFEKNGPLRARRSLVLSARLMSPDALRWSGVPEDSPGVAKVAKLAKSHDSKWELSYNLACYYSWLATPAQDHPGASLPERVGESLTWLETALEKPGSGQITCSWLKADPDLDTIRDERRFTWILEQISERQPKQPPEPVRIGASPSVPARPHTPCPATSVA